MNLSEKAKVLGEQSRYDLSSPERDSPVFGSLYPAAGPAGTFPVFKTLMSSACTYDCRYCQQPVCKNAVTYEPEELAKVFLPLARSGEAKGLFLTSGVLNDPNLISEKMLDAVKIIRAEGFSGYIHFKVLPGVSKDIINEAAEHADRLSINLEAPTKERLSELSTNKDFFKDILKRQEWIKKAKPKSGQTTQMIVGAGDETDLELLKAAEKQYGKLGSKRVYYSGFQPVCGTPLEGKEASPRARERRLYNIDFMMRHYGISLKEFKELMSDGMLPQGDPKLNLALKGGTKVDLGSAEMDELLKIPGIGPVKAQCIAVMREMGIPLDEKKLSMLSLGKSRPFLKDDETEQKSISDY